MSESFIDSERFSNREIQVFDRIFKSIDLESKGYFTRDDYQRYIDSLKSRSTTLSKIASLPSFDNYLLYQNSTVVTYHNFLTTLSLVGIRLTFKDSEGDASNVPRASMMSSTPIYSANTITLPATDIRIKQQQQPQFHQHLHQLDTKSKSSQDSSSSSSPAANVKKTQPELPTTTTTPSVSNNVPTTKTKAASSLSISKVPSSSSSNVATGQQPSIRSASSLSINKVPTQQQQQHVLVQQKSSSSSSKVPAKTGSALFSKLPAAPPPAPKEEEPAQEQSEQLSPPSSKSRLDKLGFHRDSSRK
ncbi:hypothetical protein SAMD00019534_120240 [Acytostelium subglobosum LB1]|uniref:hypothetical protein n=1 Tax=Acytostelium subglobosum LB1 TaxID=1410327 RepID=UPI000644D303|nr:hypothetical protein SAMD00019534_120240 [Acytostelium subglobosum LB1]GAM28848.1 hypothetical protein SAMD00019534_120240 [Acytostelium subglobosum LB1]|eukprot:XP_012748220.1 hypothetical protein SAMD00019534_120240 [Acytostelium subglobosum LB1]